jgi:hypothetical protein
MYEVITVITPINYFIRYPNALDRLNADTHTSLNELDIIVLGILNECGKGLRNASIMRALKKRYYEPKFIRTIHNLVDLQYIVRTEYHKSVFYSITLQGKTVLMQFNDNLIALASTK